MKKRQVNKSEQVICCDIDDTIVLWNPEAPGDKIEIPCPHSLHGHFDLKTHEPHIRLVKERLARGAVMIVWSAGGWAWADSVFEALGIDHENIHIYSKPYAYIDDSECQNWMGDRIYLPADSHWRIRK
jgi:hypothetical protein